MNIVRDNMVSERQQAGSTVAATYCAFDYQADQSAAEDRPPDPSTSQERIRPSLSLSPRLS